MAQAGELVDTIAPGDSVLVATPSSAPLEELYASLQAAATTPTDYLGVALQGTIDDHVTFARGAPAVEPPDRIGVVAVDPMTRGASADGSGAGPNGENVSVSTVSNASNLTRIGVAITEYLDDWNTEGRRLVCHFDSVTTLLRYTDQQRAYQFLHPLTHHLTVADAVGLYYLHIPAHEERTIHRLAQLFDALVEPVDGVATGAADPNPELRIRRR